MDAGGSYPQLPSRLRPFVSEEAVPMGSAPAGESARPVEVSPLRPYLLTGGRVRPVDTTLEIEAQVVTTEVGYRAAGTQMYERRDILELCVEPHAVVEVGARLRLHVGVVRVLVGDLVALGYLAVRRPESVPHRNVQILERVIRGLQAID
jgi:hypothetical protein